MTAPLRLGTRGSVLARTQSGHVADAITAATGRAVELVILRTRGDNVTDRPLSQVGGKGLFTKELEDALLAGDVDLAVHSMKDMPTEQPPGLHIPVVPERVDPRDALVGARLVDLPEGAVVGTGSARRAAQILALRPDLTVRGIRGNVDTRIQKQRDGEYDAIVLAAAGMKRMGRLDDAAELLDVSRMLPAVGQGALAVQCRIGDADTEAALQAIHHPGTAVAVQAERAFLRTISGGCSVPAACHAVLDDQGLLVRGFYAPEGGSPRTAEARGPLDQAASLGAQVARAVLAT